MNKMIFCNHLNIATFNHSSLQKSFTKSYMIHFQPKINKSIRIMLVINNSKYDKYLIFD